MQDRVVNILLVDDDEVDVMTARRVFRKIGISHPLFVASNGLEALEMLKGRGGQRPIIPLENRLILLDLNMPKMGGIEFLQVLRAEPELKSTPVVVLTTSSDERDRIQAYNHNVAGYLLKPMSMDVFAHTMSILNTYWTTCEMP
jgi:CheY-like chemotaxis protein